MSITSCILYGPKDVRIEQRPAEILGSAEVRVRMGAAGICGSDQHYYEIGRVGSFVLRQPLVPGHEMCGDIIEVGSGVTTVRPGDRVAVDPAMTCGRCDACRRGLANLCTNVQFMGSASCYPHIAGGFRSEFVVHVERCHVAPATVPHEVLVFAEPLSIALHAAQRAGTLLGKRIFIAGAGTIGTLIAAVARAAGASEIVVSDFSAQRRQIALSMGANRTLDPAAGAAEMRTWDEMGGAFDIGFEATGSRHALPDVIRSITRGGRAILVGMIPTGECDLPFHHMSTREIDLVSTFRQNNVFKQAVDMLASGSVDPAPILTSAFGLDAAQRAFEASLDRDTNIKVIFVPDGDAEGTLKNHALH